MPKTDLDLAFTSAADLAQMIAKRKVSAVDVVLNSLMAVNHAVSAYRSGSTKASI